MKDVPSDYYRRLHAIENSHWWHLGMRRISGALLDLRDASGLALLDCGCGTGGFLGWAARTHAFSTMAGVDISPEALAIAHETVPEANLALAPMHELPFAAESFDLVVLNDVLQHVDEDHVAAGLTELRRVLRPHGRLLLRTNGGRRARRERPDWRLYDSVSLANALRQAELAIVRLTHANMLLSGWGALRGRSPKAPTATTCGIPSTAGSTVNAIGSAVLRAEAAYLRPPGRRLPYGHTLFAVATPELR
jgi:2-polyprenyl-3-methyl-5-hydroxy-6-metoxy-1,4-benzoquinol methylase